MLKNKMTVKVGSETYNKMIAIESLCEVQSVYIKLTEVLHVIRHTDVMGGEDSDFDLKLSELHELVRDELNRHSNRIIGIDEETEIVIASE